MKPMLFPRNAALCLAVKSRRVRVGDGELAACRLVEAADQVQKRRLAAPRRPDEGDEGGGFDLEADLLKRRDASPRPSDSLSEYFAPLSVPWCFSL